MKLLVYLVSRDSGLYLARADGSRAGCVEARLSNGMPLTIEVREVEVPV